MQYIKCFTHNTSIIYLTKDKQDWGLMIDDKVINKVFSTEDAALLWVQDNLEIYDNF